MCFKDITLFYDSFAMMPELKCNKATKEERVKWKTTYLTYVTAISN